jgi:hypothetical protein
VFQTNIVEKIKTHFTFDNFFLEIRAFNEMTWKNIVERGWPQMDNMAHAHCMLDYVGLQIHTQNM